jgi:formate dehydrogenase assembly factor FdhD
MTPMGRVTTRVRRTRLDVVSGARVERTDTVAVEEPLEIRVDNNSLTTTMRTPGDDFDLAIGHLLTEGLLHGADEVATLMHCTDLDESGSPTFNVVDVTLAPGAVLHRAPRERTQGMTSACGSAVGVRGCRAHEQSVCRGGRPALPLGGGRGRAPGRPAPAATRLRAHRWGPRGRSRDGIR